MNAMRLALVRLGSFAVDLTQSIVTTLGGGNGDPTRLQESPEARRVKPKKKPKKRAGRRR